MTPQEAIVKFKGIMKAEIDRIPCQYDAEVEDDVYSDIDKVDEILQVNKVICGALEKQIPKKPEITAIGNLVKTRCNICGFTNSYVDWHTAQYKYCPSCGHAIDWSDEE